MQEYRAKLLTITVHEYAYTAQSLPYKMATVLILAIYAHVHRLSIGYTPSFDIICFVLLFFLCCS